MTDPVKSVSVFTITLPRDTPYLGALRPGEEPNANGYFVRKGNRTVYAMFDRTLIVRVETMNGVVGWGETYGAIAPGAPAAIINDLLAPFIVGRDPLDASVIHDDLYDLMRVRGYIGGFYLDALAAVDIALWDASARSIGLPLAKLLGGQRRTEIPAYVSGLPERTRTARADLAASWQGRGFNAFKFAAPVSDDGVVKETETLRERLGDDALIACDMHWAHSAEEAISLIRAMEPYRLWFAEAPVHTEDHAGLARVAAGVSTPIASGEEWRTAYELVPRVERRSIGILQPEMGHIGVTEFLRMGLYAQAHHLRMIPHATIGTGLFLAASLQVSSALAAVEFHEFQHSIFEPNRRLLKGNMDCAAGYYTLPAGPGLGVEPSEEALRLLRPVV